MDFIVTTDEHLQSRILRKAKIERADFDPSNKQHLVSYKKFLDTGNWGDIQFYCEYPYFTVPETISRKFGKFALSQILDGQTKA